MYQNAKNNVIECWENGTGMWWNVIKCHQKMWSNVRLKMWSNVTENVVECHQMSSYVTKCRKMWLKMWLKCDQMLDLKCDQMWLKMWENVIECHQM